MGNKIGIDRRKAIQLIGGGAWLAACAGRAPTLAIRSRPNVIFIMTDDHAQSAVGAYGNKILKTPNLDRIAGEGLRFEEAFVTNSLCLPSRATYLTGQYSHKHGLRTNGEESGFTGEPKLRQQETWPNLLRSAGYHTAVVGKWHINTPPAGYAYTAVLPGQAQYFDPEMLINGAMTKQRGHTDDVIGEQALAFLESRPTDRRSAFSTTSRRRIAAGSPPARFARGLRGRRDPAYRATLRGQLEGRPEALRERADGDRRHDRTSRDRGVPAHLPPPTSGSAGNLEELVKNYYRTLLGVDENVGRVLDVLDARGPHARTRSSSSPRTTASSSASTASSTSGSCTSRRSACRCSCADRPASGRRTCRRGDIALNIDVAPTILALAGVRCARVDAGLSVVTASAGDDAPVARGFSCTSSSSFRTRTIACGSTAGSVARQWKLIHFCCNRRGWSLTISRRDPDETTNLAARPEHAEQLRQMQDRLAELRRQFDDIDPPGFVPVASDPRHCPP